MTPRIDVIILKYNMDIAGLKNSNNFRNSHYERDAGIWRRESDEKMSSQ